MAGKKKTIVADAKTEKKEVVTSLPKTMKVKMLKIYCGDFNLYAGRVYDIDSKLGMELIKNGDAEKC